MIVYGTNEPGLLPWAGTSSRPAAIDPAGTVVDPNTNGTEGVMPAEQTMNGAPVQERDVQTWTAKTCTTMLSVSMFAGHLAVALSAKKVAPKVPLAVLVASAFGADLLWPIFLLVGLETVRIDPGNTAFTPLAFVSYPWSHSLAMGVVWAAIAGHFARRAFGSMRAGLVVSALVVSHWLLDYITHRPDLPLWPFGPRVGLDLWDSVSGTIEIEGLLFAAGIAIYQHATRAIDAQGRWAFVALVVVVGGAWLSGPFSPPPPSVPALTVVALILAVVLPLWCIWIEKHRTFVDRRSGLDRR